MIKQLMNNLIPAAKMAAGKAPAAQQMARPISTGVNHFAGPSAMAGKAVAPAMHQNPQVAAQLKGLNLNPNQPKVSGKSWIA